MGKDSVRRIYMPYCMQRLGDGRYIVLNRLYKPLGIVSRNWITYEEHPTALQVRGMTPALAQKLSWKGSDSVECIYLYNDGCVPTDSAENWHAYSERLRLLSSLQIEV